MTDEEFWQYVEIEGLEYFLCHKTEMWKFLFNEELLNWCYKYVEAYNNIRALR